MIKSRVCSGNQTGDHFEITSAGADPIPLDYEALENARSGH